MLSLCNLSLTFSPGTPNAHKALKNLSLTLAPGDFVTIVGSNGAGKSTLFGAICATLPLDSGTVLLDGQDLTGLPEYKRALTIGHLFQDPMKGTAPGMTIAENLALAYARASRAPLSRALRKGDLDRFRVALSAFHMGLEDRLSAKVGLLSGGQRQALTLLMSTIAHPKLLLLDEHTAALDPATAQTVLRITQDIIDSQKLTTMMITHNLQSALALGNRTIMMDDGEIVLDLCGEARACMTPSDLLSCYAKARGSALDNDRILLSMAK
ncbi:MAG: ATP-binding cassette domain-containing protein [Clostridia bacterium]